jgi:hypothetical protein
MDVHQRHGVARARQAPRQRDAYSTRTDDMSLLLHRLPASERPGPEA